MLSHALSFEAAYVGLGFIAPLIVLLTMGERSRFIREHAVESVNFQLTTLQWVAGATVLAVLTFGLGLIVSVPAAGFYAIFYLVVVIIAATHANRGESYRYPLSIRFVR